MRYVLILLGLMLAGVANAIDCETHPDCTSLGYSKTEEPNCATDGYVLCPFDEAYKRCIDYDCAKLGFTESDKSSWCADLIKCTGNQKMTLCQKSCFATDYESLKDLAESGKCKTVTIIKDFSCTGSPKVKVVTNTTVDGGGHMISLINTTGDFLTMNNNTVLKNIKIHKTLDLKDISATDVSIPSGSSVVLENVEIDDLTPPNMGTTIWRYAIFNHGGTVTFLGTNKISTDGIIALNSGTYNLKDSKLELNSITAASILYQTTINADHAEIIATCTQKKLSQGSTITLKNNSRMYVNAVGSLAYTPTGTDKIRLESGSELELQTANSHGGITIFLAGSAQAPVKMITHDWVGNNTKLDVQDLNATLHYENEIYKPKSIAVTPISSVRTSPNWEKLL